MRRDFVANISHELKTPVGALGLLSDVLVGESDPNEIRRLTAPDADASRVRLGRIVEEPPRPLADRDRRAARARAGRRSSSWSPTPIERTRTPAEHQGVSLESRRIDPALAVIGDPQPARVSALQNLLDNAVKYSDDGVDGRGVGAGRSATRSSWSWPTTGSASRRATSSGSSSASTGSTGRGPATPAAPASACRSSGTSRRTTEVTSPSRPARVKGPMFTLRLPAASIHRRGRRWLSRSRPCSSSRTRSRSSRRSSSV